MRGKSAVDLARELLQRFERNISILGRSPRTFDNYSRHVAALALGAAAVLLAAAWLNLAFVAVSEKMIVWFGLEAEPSIWISFVASMLLLAFVMRKG